MNGIRFLGNHLSILKKLTDVGHPFYGIRNFSSLISSKYDNSCNNLLITSNNKPLSKTNLNLIPYTGNVTQSCGLKIVGKPKPRCKHCYYAGIDGVLYNLCDVYPRHKQRALKHGKKKYGWLLTHACQSKYRPW